jgi:hypothetical protein
VIALKLAEDYGLTTWIVALLDPAPIEKGTTKDKERLEIATPPRFEIPDKLRFVHHRDDTSIASSVRSRNRRRSVSPTKATPSRKIASPRKPRTGRKARTEELGSASALAQVLENGGTGESVNGDYAEGDLVRVEVNEVTETKGDTDITKTTVAVEMPAGHPELPLPESAEEMVAKAREMVAEATKADAVNGIKGKSPRKRKAAEITVDDEDEAGAADGERSAKKVKADQTLRKEKMKFRATVGIAVTLALG